MMELASVASAALPASLHLGRPPHLEALARSRPEGLTALTALAAAAAAMAALPAVAASMHRLPLSPTYPRNLILTVAAPLPPESSMSPRSPKKSRMNSKRDPRRHPRNPTRSPRTAYCPTQPWLAWELQLHACLDQLWGLVRPPLLHFVSQPAQLMLLRVQHRPGTLVWHCALQHLAQLLQPRQQQPVLQRLAQQVARQQLLRQLALQRRPPLW
mmetsp:Transcript_164098/g.315232  ORF Transcript_164098/g.315232 Transcript_164098/m.315232 type:complete len:214 (-) Transcript_164098:1753-2394(-)